MQVAGQSPGDAVNNWCIELHEGLLGGTLSQLHEIYKTIHVAQRLIHYNKSRLLTSLYSHII